MADHDDSPPSPAVLIRVTRSGGLLGRPRAWCVASPDDAVRARWQPLLDACPWTDDPPTPTGADRFTWHIEVRAPEPPRAALLPDAAVDGPWRELVDRVRTEGAAERRGGSA